MELDTDGFAKQPGCITAVPMEWLPATPANPDIRSNPPAGKGTTGTSVATAYACSKLSQLVVSTAFDCAEE
jgi:hypothetical protein